MNRSSKAAVFLYGKEKQTNSYKKGGGRVIYDPRPSIMKKILLILITFICYLGYIVLVNRE